MVNLVDLRAINDQVSGGNDHGEPVIHGIPIPPCDNQAQASFNQQLNDQNVIIIVSLPAKRPGGAVHYFPCQKTSAKAFR